MEELTKAYRTKALKEHPDKGGDADQFQKIREAFAILRNSQKCRAHSRTANEQVARDGETVVISAKSRKHPRQLELTYTFAKRTYAARKQWEWAICAFCDKNSLTQLP